MNSPIVPSIRSACVVQLVAMCRSDDVSVPSIVRALSRTNRCWCFRVAWIVPVSPCHALLPQLDMTPLLYAPLFVVLHVIFLPRSFCVIVYVACFLDAVVPCFASRICSIFLAKCYCDLAFPHHSYISILNTCSLLSANLLIICLYIVTPAYWPLIFPSDSFFLYTGILDLCRFILSHNSDYCSCFARRLSTAHALLIPSLDSCAIALLCFLDWIT